jgi:hypothetical protein
MTVTISIINDRDTSAQDVYDCLNCRGDGCAKCDHKGVIVRRYSRFTLNLANANFSTLWAALGLDEEGGYISGIGLLSVLRSYRPGSVCRATRVDGNMIDCGIDQDRGIHYIDKLREIAMEAARLEEKVCWG